MIMGYTWVQQKLKQNEHTYFLWLILQKTTTENQCTWHYINNGRLDMTRGSRKTNNVYEGTGGTWMSGIGAKKVSSQTGELF